MKMDWIDWSKFEEPEGCTCDELADCECPFCTCKKERIAFAVRQTIEHCAKIAEGEDNGDLGGRYAERIAEKIRESRI